MKLSVGADGRLPMVDAVLKYLKEQGHEISWYGPETIEEGYVPYPDVALFSRLQHIVFVLHNQVIQIFDVTELVQGIPKRTRHYCLSFFSV